LAAARYCAAIDVNVSELSSDCKGIWKINRIKLTAQRCGIAPILCSIIEHLLKINRHHGDVNSTWARRGALTVDAHVGVTELT